MIPINMGNGSTMWLPIAHHASGAAGGGEPAPEWLVIVLIVLVGIVGLSVIGFIVWSIIDHFKNGV